MQRPTLTNVRIRSTRDALVVFAAVARSALPLIVRRLDAEERRTIVPGNVYVWEERGANTEATGLGMERWTDGRSWGPSRVRDDFLFYHQKESDYDDPVAPVTPWAQMMRKRDAAARGAAPPAGAAERLIKQTYSVHVSLPAERARGIVRKWHLTAYFSQQRLDALATVDTLRGLGDVPVPDGWFRSARASKARRGGGGGGASGGPLPGAPPDGVVVPSQRAPAAHAFGAGAGAGGAYAGGAGWEASPPLSDDSSGASTPPPGAFSPPPHHPHAHLQPPAHAHAPPPHLSAHAPPHHPPHAHSPHAPSPHVPPRPPSGAGAGQLVPLQYLQSLAPSSARRDPADEQLLRRFSMHTIDVAARR